MFCNKDPSSPNWKPSTVFYFLKKEKQYTSIENSSIKTKVPHFLYCDDYVLIIPLFGNEDRHKSKEGMPKYLNHGSGFTSGNAYG